MPRPGDEAFEMGECEVIQKTPKSVLVKTTEHGEQWIPFSQIHDDSEVYETTTIGDTGKLVIKQWLAEYRGWC